MIVCLSPNGAAVTRDAEIADVLLVGTIRGVVEYRRDEQSQWVEHTRHLEDVHVSSIAVDPANDIVLVGGHGQCGLHVSRDGGRTYTAEQQGIEEQHIFHVAVQSRGGSVVYFAGVEPAALYRSDDLGRSWTLLPALRDVPGTEKWTFPPPPHIAHAKNVAWHPSRPEEFLVCVEQGALLHTTDDGQSFVENANYESPEDRWYHDVHRIVYRDRNPEEFFLAGGEGVYRSLDGGRTFTQVQTRFDRLGYPDALVFNPHDEDEVFVAGAGEPPRTWTTQDIGTANAAVIVSRDGGESFKEVPGEGLGGPLRGNIEAMSVHGDDEGFELFIGTATGEVFASTDAGDTWTTVGAELPPISKVHHYRWFLSPEERQRIEDLARAGH